MIKCGRCGDTEGTLAHAYLVNLVPLPEVRADTGNQKIHNILFGVGRKWFTDEVKKSDEMFCRELKNINYTSEKDFCL